MVMAMNRTHQSRNVADGAHQLWRAAVEFEQSASGGDTGAALPEALDDLKETLELLATGVAKASQAIEDHAGSDMRSPRARALRWHLSHLSARVLGARDVCPETRRWAPELMNELDVEPAPDDAVSDPAAAAMAAAFPDATGASPRGSDSP